MGEQVFGMHGAQKSLKKRKKKCPQVTKKIQFSSGKNMQLSTSILLLLSMSTAAKKHRGKQEQLRGQPKSFFSFRSPTYMNLDFFEFSLNTGSTISSYVLHVDTSVALLNYGYLVSWTLYGAVGENGTAPTSPDDPSWNVVDAQFNVDFSVPENNLNPGLFTYKVSNLFNSNQTYQYFGIVGVINPPFTMPTTIRFINPVVEVDFYS